MLRRNGKPKACEPCRISKVRCDHITPACRNCVKRGITGQCFYHPAPMTRARDGDASSVSPRIRRAQLPKRTAKSRASQSSEAPITPLDASGYSDQTTYPTMSLVQTRDVPGITIQPAYLGSTSYASVFTLTEEPSFPRSYEPSDMSFVFAAPGAQFHRSGLEEAIVANLPPLEIIECYVTEYFQYTQFNAVPACLIIPALHPIMNQLRRGLCADKDTRAAFLAQVTRNTMRPMNIPKTITPGEFHTLFTEDNLRWEALGVIFAICGQAAAIGAYDRQAARFCKSNGFSLNSITQAMVRASNGCVDLCHHSDIVNELSVWLMYQNGILLTNAVGEDSHIVWRRFGDAATDIFAVGWHQASALDVPLFLRETRKRLFAVIYRADKNLATFLGRPPRISKHYSVVQMPLELDDSALAKQGSELNAEVAALDSSGWNSDKKFRSVTWIRLRYSLSLLREEILEIYQKSDQEKGEEKLNALLNKCHDLWYSFPDHVRYNENSWKEHDNEICVAMITTYMERLGCEFQIQRLIARRRQEPCSEALLDISMRLLKTVMDLVRQQRGIHEGNRNFSWMFLFYGLPCSGVLAISLRRLTKAQQPFPPSISRSELIRNLCLLNLCLDWAETLAIPEQNNFKLCASVNQLLRSILDEVLNYQPCSTKVGIPTPSEGELDITNIHIPSTPAINQHENENTTSNDIMLSCDEFHTIYDGIDAIPMENEGFLNWLESVDWGSNVLPSC